MNEAFLPREETFIDCCGTPRTFLLFESPGIGKNNADDGYVVTAREVAESESGYEFSAWSPCLGDCLGKLRGKIRRGIATRHLVRNSHGRLDMIQNRISGLISVGGMIVDGVFYRWETLVDIFASCEGLKMEIQIADPAD
ncbi:MAG: hypothetical protein WC952_14390 [Desulfobulbaceae bacterium]